MKHSKAHAPVCSHATALVVARQGLFRALGQVKTVVHTPSCHVTVPTVKFFNIQFEIQHTAGCRKAIMLAMILT